MASENNLEGEIPGQFQGCPALSVLDLSSNNFSGTIPPSIASCERLVNLNLNNNQLSGEIPMSISRMPTLAVLDMSNNLLTGRIPQDFGSSAALELLNVSYNKLQGPVPENGLLRTINPDDLAGNVALCGGSLPPCDHSSPVGSRSARKKHIIVEWIIGITSVLAFGMSLVFAWSLYRRWHINGSCFEESLEMGNGEWPWRLLAFRRLLAFQRLGFTSSDILACIKESNQIGMGATGTVYKAEIPRVSTVVAVKRLWRSTADLEAGAASGDFVSEVNLLGKLRHKNIVRLLGFLHNDTEMMILYEYMQNGNLGEALHSIT
ncbi:MDIS1-interacting receptor like kinase 1 [Linum perenne]